MQPIANYSAAFLLCIATQMTFGNSAAYALEINQAIEGCRNSTGKPAYFACKQAGGTHEACFGKARSLVQSCVRSAMIAAHPKAALFSADKLSAPLPQGKPDAADIAKDAAAGLVAPPRSVADISAVLDQQKPDPAAAAALAATADAVVPAGLKGAELAAFYYKRAQARVRNSRSAMLRPATTRTSEVGTSNC
jgi:hypothetical protein